MLPPSASCQAETVTSPYIADIEEKTSTVVFLTNRCTATSTFMICQRSSLQYSLLQKTQQSDPRLSSES